MTITETLKDVKFVIGSDGQPTAALVDIVAWQRVVDFLEEAEDQGVIRAYLTRRRAASTSEEMGLIPWERAEAELDAREERGDAAMG